MPQCCECGQAIAARPHRLRVNPNRRCLACHKKTWTTVRKHIEGYREIRLGIGHWMLEHRFVMEQHLGRKLAQGEVVHHINHIRDDNRIENLELCASPGRHVADFHPRPGPWEGKTFSQEHRRAIGDGIIRFHEQRKANGILHHHTLRALEREGDATRCEGQDIVTCPKRDQFRTDKGGEDA